MKKIIIGAIVVIAVIVAGNFYISNQVKSNNEKILSVLLPKYVKHSSTYKKNLLTTQVSNEIVYPKDTLNSLLGADLVSQDLKFRISYTTQSSIFGIFNGFKTDGYTEFLSFDDAVKKIFGSNKIAEFSVVSSIAGNHKFNINTPKIDFKLENGINLIASPISSNLELNSDGIKKINSYVPNFAIKYDDAFVKFDSNLTNYNYETTYETPMKIDFYMNLNNLISKFSLEELNFSMENLKISLKDLIGEANMEIYGDKFETNSNTNAKILDITLADKIYNIRNFNYDLTLKDFSKQFFEMIYALSQQMRLNTMYAYDIFLKTSPKIYINNIGFTDGENRNFNFDLKLGLENFNGEEDKILDYAFLSGNLELDKHYMDLLFQKNPDAKEMILSQFFIKNGENLKTKFEFNKKKQDIIINNYVGLSEIFGRF